jgi:hypothetical protein
LEINQIFSEEEVEDVVTKCIPIFGLVDDETIEVINELAFKMRDAVVKKIFSQKHKWEEVGYPAAEVEPKVYVDSTFGCMGCGLILAPGVKPESVKCPCIGGK